MKALLLAFLGSTIAAAQPVVLAAVNSASFAAPLSPGSLVTIFGQQLALDNAQASDIPLPLALIGTSVEIDGNAAPLYFVSSTVINAQIPFEARTGSVPLVVRTGAGSSGPYMLKVNSSAPGIFSLAANGKGHGIFFDPAFQPHLDFNPGDYILFYATGLGATGPPAQSGSGGASTEPFNRVISPPDLYIGESKAQIAFAGLAPSLVGVYQVNAIVPNLLLTDRVFFRKGNSQSNAVSFARLYPGTETIYASSGSALGTTFDFDAGVSANVRSTIQTAAGFASSYFVSAGLSDPGTGHIFALTDLQNLSAIYAQWNGSTLDLARNNLQSNDAITGPGVTWVSVFQADWAHSPPAIQAKIIAHECFHQLQFKLDPEGISAPNDQVPLNGPRWLTEGSAEYMGYKAVAANGLISLSDVLSEETTQARRVNVPLAGLETLSGLQAAGPNEGYPLLFMAIDFLVSKTNLLAVAMYYSLIGQGLLWPQAFQTAFGESIDQFYKDFEPYRATHYAPYASIRGTVTDSSGAPYPGISAFACEVQPPGPCAQSLTDSAGHYAIPVDNGGYIVSFGRSTDGNNVDGFYTTQGLVTDQSKATIVNVRGTDVSGIDARMPFTRPSREVPSAR